MRVALAALGIAAIGVTVALAGLPPQKHTDMEAWEAEHLRAQGLIPLRPEPAWEAHDLRREAETAKHEQQQKLQRSLVRPAAVPAVEKKATQPARNANVESIKHAILAHEAMTPDELAVASCEANLLYRTEPVQSDFCLRQTERATVALERATVAHHTSPESAPWDSAPKISIPLAELRDRLSEELARRDSKDALVPIDRDPVPPKYTEHVRRYYEELGRSR